jgi:transcriptional regulator with XRE-family HTH domain
MTDLRQWRADNSVTVLQLASHLGCNRQTIYAWENKKNPLPADIDARLSAYVHSVPQTFATPQVPPETQFGQETAVSKEIALWLKWAKRETRKYADVPNYLPTVMEGQPNPSNAMWLAARGEFGNYGSYGDDGEWHNMPIGVYFDERGVYAGYEYLGLDHNVIAHPRAADFPRMKSGHFKPTFCINDHTWTDL